jgi:hypothetical protein
MKLLQIVFLVGVLLVGSLSCRSSEARSTGANVAKQLGPISGTWRYTPPPEMWKNQSFTLTFEQRGAQVTGRLTTLPGSPQSHPIEQQSLHGQIADNKITLQLRVGAAILANLSGIVSADGRSIVGQIHYINSAPLVWHASR